MSIYDNLPKEAKDRVDATVKTLEPLTWSDRRQKITALVLKMNPAGSEEAADPETPDPWQNPLWSAVGHYVAACIERLGFSEPDNQKGRGFSVQVLVTASYSTNIFARAESIRAGSSAIWFPTRTHSSGSPP